MKKVISILLVGIFAFILLTGCGQTSTKTSSVELGISVDDFKFCSSVNGDRDYVERTNNTFAPSERMWVYIEASNFAVKEQGGKYYYHPIVSISIKDSKGNVIFDDVMVDEELSSSTKAPYLYFPIYFDLPKDFKQDKYTLTANLKDGLGKGHATYNAQFIVKD